MKFKKNPNIDIGKSRSLYFALGIAVIMLITYLGMNYKSSKKIAQDLVVLNVTIEEENEIPITAFKSPPPPPPPTVAPVVIEIIENEEDIVETVIESTEMDETEAIEEIEVKVEEIKVEEIEEEIEVPFTIIENVPIYPGCEHKKTNSERKKCMSENLYRYVNKKFNDGLAADLGLTGSFRINVVFKIDKKGHVVEVRARAPHPALAKEAEKVVKSLPKMKPGIQKNRPVTVSYALPIKLLVKE